MLGLGLTGCNDCDDVDTLSLEFFVFFDVVGNAGVPLTVRGAAFSKIRLGHANSLVDVAGRSESSRNTVWKQDHSYQGNLLSELIDYRRPETRNSPDEQDLLALPFVSLDLSRQATLDDPIQEDPID